MSIVKAKASSFGGLAGNKRALREEERIRRLPCGSKNRRFMGFTTALSKDRTVFKKNIWLFACIAAFLPIWIDSLVGTTDIKNWLIENILVFLFLPLLIWAHRKHPFSDLSYVLITLFMCLHVYGSKYTYAENPFGYWFQDAFNTPRNPYDRLVHFGFGFLLAYPLREVFLRWWKYPTWVGWVLPIDIALSFGALYELMEWAIADVFFKAQGQAYLGTQGDVWDAQKDIFVAIVGAALAIGIFYGIKKVFKSREL